MPDLPCGATSSITTMANPEASSSDLLDHLADVKLNYSGLSHLFGIEPHDVDTLHWSVTATITGDPEGYDDEDDWMDLPGVALGRLSEDEDEDPEGDDNEVERNGDGPPSVVIFEMSGYTIDLDRVDSLFDALDSESADSAHFLWVADDSQYDHLAVDFSERLEGVGSRLVIFDRARVAPAWRGLGGVGRLLTGYALRWVAAGATCVVAQPYPYELGEQPEGSPLVADGLAVVRHTWASLGFFPYREDLYVLDPAMAAMDDALKRLEAKLLR